MDILFSEEQIEFIKKRFDVPARASDSDSTLRWKAAQREVVMDLIHCNDNLKKQGKTTDFKLRPPE